MVCQLPSFSLIFKAMLTLLQQAQMFISIWKVTKSVRLYYCMIVQNEQTFYSYCAACLQL